MSNEPERDANGRILNEYGLPVATKGIDFDIRPRRKRPKGWLAKAIKDGSVRDPALGPTPPEAHANTAVVVSAPVATIDGRMPADGDA